MTPCFCRHFPFAWVPCESGDYGGGSQKAGLQVPKFLRWILKQTSHPQGAAELRHAYAFNSRYHLILTSWTEVPEWCGDCECPNFFSKKCVELSIALQAAQEREDRLLREAKEATFHPKLSKMALQLKREGSGSSPWLRLHRGPISQSRVHI